MGGHHQQPEMLNMLMETRCRGHLTASEIRHCRGAWLLAWMDTASASMTRSEHEMRTFKPYRTAGRLPGDEALPQRLVAGVDGHRQSALQVRLRQLACTAAHGNASDHTRQRTDRAVLTWQQAGVQWRALMWH